MKVKALWNVIRPPRKTRIGRPRVKLSKETLSVKLDEADRELFLDKCDELGISASERLRTLAKRDIAEQATTDKSSKPIRHLDRARAEFELAIADGEVDVLERDRIVQELCLFAQTGLYNGGEAA